MSFKKPSKYSELDIDISKGMLVGQGINLKKGARDIENVFIPWSNLNSHFMCFGTTRQGKTRLLTFMMRQIIEKGDHLVLVEPKGSENQETVSWACQYANDFDSLGDIRYWSPEHTDLSIKINLLYGQNDEQVTDTIVGAMKVEDEFYEDIAIEILMAVLPALSFYEKTLNPLFLLIMERFEYVKILIESPLDEANKKILGRDFNPNEHSVKVDILKDLIEECHGDEKRINEIKKEYTKVKSLYVHSKNKGLPIRRFITFEDLAQYTTPENIEKFYHDIEDAINDAEAKNLDPDLLRLGYKARDELEKLSKRDKNYYSKVSTSYAVTMRRLSYGNVGKLLCESKINILQDRLYQSDKRVILIAQPFPMKYSKAANMAIKMLMSFMNSYVTEVGVSGKANSKRVHTMIDEAGSIANSLMLSLANKGGGLGLSMYLYSQSFADYKDTLGEEGATILADNANSKGFFLVNDDKSAETISALIGSKKMGDVSYGSSEGSQSRTQGRAVEEALIPPSLIMQLHPMTYAMKTGKDVYMMSAPFQRDPLLIVSFPSVDLKGSAEKNAKYVESILKAVRK